MYEQIGCFDPNTMEEEEEGSTSQKYGYPRTDRNPPQPPKMVAVADSNNNLEENNLRLSVEELSHHHHNLLHPEEDISTFANGVSAASMYITHPQHMNLNMENPYNNNNNNMGTHLGEENIEVLPYDQCTWDPRIQELQDLAFANHHDQQPHDQHQFQQIEAQNCSQSFNSSSIVDPPPYPLNLLPSVCITNPTQKTPNFHYSMGFLGDIPIGPDNTTSASSVLYDPLFHLNLQPSHPRALRELFQSLPHGNNLPRNGSIFGGGDEIAGNEVVYQEGDGNQVDIGVLEFNTGTGSAGNGREGKGVKHFATEKQRREQLNGKYKTLRSLIPNPTKADRASVVGDAIDYIRELIRTVNELKLLVEKKRYVRQKCKRHKTEDDAAERCNIKPFVGDPDGCIRTSWLQRKSKDSEVDVRIIDDEVTIKLVQRKKINCLLFVSKVLDELQLDLHHVAGGHVGEYCSFLFNNKIIEGSTVYASAIANRVIEVMDTQYAADVPLTNSY